MTLQDSQNETSHTRIWSQAPYSCHPWTYACQCCPLPGHEALKAASNSGQHPTIWFYAQLHLHRCATYWHCKIQCCINLFFSLRNLSYLVVRWENVKVFVFLSSVFDNDCGFMSPTPGFNLYLVAAHEFGHALGLKHSQNPQSLMYPTYRNRQPQNMLSSEDIMNINALYGINSLTFCTHVVHRDVLNFPSYKV